MSRFPIAHRTPEMLAEMQLKSRRRRGYITKEERRIAREAKKKSIQLKREARWLKKHPVEIRPEVDLEKVFRFLDSEAFRKSLSL